MIYVYTPRASTSAHDLAGVLGGVRLRKFDGMDFWKKGKRFHIQREDAVVCWGGTLPKIDGVKVLNGAPHLTKLMAGQTMLNAGVASVQVFSKDPSLIYGKTALKGMTFLPRKNIHVGGDDLLTPTNAPDFYTKKEAFIREYRIHMFDGKSIRAGVKVPREEFDNPHEWIRTFDAGWRINYDGFKSTKKMRELAAKAVKVLGLTFGAVDLGELAKDTFMVLEVNRAPGSSDGTIEAYSKAILNWIDGTPRGTDADEI